MEEIKDCPFCGYMAEIRKRESVMDNGEWFDVRCTNNKCYLCDGADWHHDTVGEAIELWNRRTE